MLRLLLLRFYDILLKDYFKFTEILKYKLKRRTERRICLKELEKTGPFKSVVFAS